MKVLDKLVTKCPYCKEQAGWRHIEADIPAGFCIQECLTCHKQYKYQWKLPIQEKKAKQTTLI